MKTRSATTVPSAAASAPSKAVAAAPHKRRTQVKPKRSSAAMVLKTKTKPSSPTKQTQPLSNITQVLVEAKSLPPKQRWKAQCDTASKRAANRVSSKTTTKQQLQTELLRRLYHEKTPAKTVSDSEISSLLVPYTNDDLESFLSTCPLEPPRQLFKDDTNDNDDANNSKCSQSSVSAIISRSYTSTAYSSSLYTSDDDSDKESLKVSSSLVTIKHQPQRPRRCESRLVSNDDTSMFVAPSLSAPHAKQKPQAALQSFTATNLRLDPVLQPVAVNSAGMVAMALSHDLVLSRYNATVAGAAAARKSTKTTKKSSSIVSAADVVKTTASVAAYNHRLVTFPTGYFSSVAWCPLSPNALAVGTSDGCVTLYDTERTVRLCKFKAHAGRVAALAWRPENAHCWTSGGADGRIVQFDSRVAQPIEDHHHHQGEVCCVAWQPPHAATGGGGSRFASGGADKLLLLWDSARTDSGPYDGLEEPDATAVSALAWSPSGSIGNSALLAFAGGPYGSHIRVINTNNHTQAGAIDTGSSITALAWQPDHPHRLVSSHASSQICSWNYKYPSLSFSHEYKGHSSCVLHMGIAGSSSSASSSLLYSVEADDLVKLWRL